MNKIKNGDLPASPIFNSSGASLHESNIGLHEGCVSGFTKRESFFQSNMTAMMSNPMITERHTIEQIRLMIIENTDWAMKELDNESN